MLFDKFIRRQTKGPKSKKGDSPPPLDEEYPLPSQWSSQITTNIKASDTPQWRWTSSQCKAWLFAVLTSYMDYEPTLAEELVSKMEGYGPNIYSRQRESWVELLGYENGNGLYLMLLSVRHQKGAIPKNIRINGGYPSQNLESCSSALPYTKKKA